MNLKFFTAVWAALLVGAVVLVVASELVSPETKDFMFKEGAIIESVSAIGYFVAALLLFIQILKRMPNRWSSFLIVLFFGLRELDFDKRFTTMGIFKSRFYSSSHVPVLEKLIGLLIILALFACAYFLIKKYFHPFMTGLKRGGGIAWSVLFIGGALAVSKTIDGIGRKLEPFGVETTEMVDRLTSSIEEVMELGASLLLLVVVIAFYRMPSPESDIATSD
jgi:hypothetical protein